MNMAYDKKLAAHMYQILQEVNPPGLVEKKMFGGVGYLVQGNMACGVHGNELIVRVGTDGYVDALNRPGARPFDLTGRPMNGWVSVRPSGFPTSQVLQEWVNLGVQFALTLPPN
jgi:TfoX/Sxy family transcriptional regulator of competence genes